MRIVVESATPSGVPSASRVLPDSTVRYINRDHVTLAAFAPASVEVITITGIRIMITGSPEEMANFEEILVQDVQSNFCRFPSRTAEPNGDQK